MRSSNCRERTDQDRNEQLLAPGSMGCYCRLVMSSGNTKRIKLLQILPETLTTRGFDQRGCYGCDCNDACCRYGTDIDRESYDLILRHRNEIEPLIGSRIEDCVVSDWRQDPEFLGGATCRSKVGPNGYCSFHMPQGKGCALYSLAMRHGLPKRIIPTICRLYPLSWGEGILGVSDSLEEQCNCFAPDNLTSKSLLATQAAEIHEIFDVSAISARTTGQSRDMRQRSDSAETL